jgi:hypothetical protein
MSPSDVQIPQSPYSGRNFQRLVDQKDGNSNIGNYWGLVDV